MENQNCTECRCGGRYTRNNKSRHMNTEKHRNYEYVQYSLEQLRLEEEKELLEKERLFRGYEDQDEDEDY